MEKSSDKYSGRAHPNLRGGSLRFSHRFGSRQMKALAAVCETFVPSVRMDADGMSSDVDPGSSKFPITESGINSREASAKCDSDDLVEFYRLSASDLDVSSRVAAITIETLRPEVVKAVGLILWLMSTFLGTLLLFGTISFSWRYPFFLSFVRFSQERRERALLRWESSKVSVLAQMFKLFKVLAMFIFYSYADESGHNPAWSAIGFPGADPKASESDSGTPRPLEGKVLEVNPELSSEEQLASFLKDGGFSLLDPEGVSRLRSVSRAESGDRSKGGREIGVNCDVLVVGSGSGGGVVAGALAQAGYKVLVLEKGAYYARNDLSLLEGPSLAGMYENLSALSTDDGVVAIQAGATVGGGSAINWAASFRTPEHVRREWAKDLGLSFFASKQYEEAMDKVCARGSVTSSCKKMSFQNQILTKGCEKLGFHVGVVPCNVNDEHNCGWCHLGCKGGQKQATTETWLVDAVEAGSLIVPNCSVREVLHRDSESGSKKKSIAIGAIASWGKDVTLYVASKVTVVCGGALSTPTVLLRSGLKNPNIGRHLRLHPVVMCWGYFPEDGDSGSYSGTNFEGPVMTAVSRQAANCDTSGYGAVMEVPILHPGAFSALTLWQSGVQHKRRMKRYSRTAHFIILTRDKGSGRVGLNEEGYRRITYKMDAQDEEHLMEGLQNGLRAMRAAGAEELGTQHQGGQTFSRRKPRSESSSSNTEEELEFERFLQDVRTMGFGGVRTPFTSAHQMGSCRMGVDSESSVVDPTCETWEVEGLFLGDSSVFPTASGVNPMITVQSIALCTAQNIILKLSKSQKDEA